MGTLQSVSADQFQEGGTSELIIPLDFKKPIILQMQPLLNWSLQQIRQIYAPFKKRKGSPLLTRSQFLRFIRLSRIMSFNLYDKMFKKHSLNVFEIISMLVLTSYTNYSYKIQFLFNIFDLDCSRGLQFKELILSFKSLIRGYSILTQQPMPCNDLLEKYGQVMFSRADLNNDQCLQLGQVLSWFEGNIEGIYLFKRFQPELIGKEQYYIFNTFSPGFNDEQVRLTYQRIQKEHKKIPLQDIDFTPLNVKIDMKRIQFNQLRQTVKSMNKNLQRNSSQIKLKIKLSFRDENTTPQTQQRSRRVGFNFTQSKRASQNSSMLNTRSFENTNKNLLDLGNNLFKQNNLNQESIGNTNKSFNFNDSTNTLRTNLKLPDLQTKMSNSIKTNRTVLDRSFSTQRKFKTPYISPKTTRVKGTSQDLLASNGISTFNLSQIKEIKSKFMKKKFNGIIILKGKTITKKQIFDLREYYESLASGKNAIFIQNFIQAFNQQKYNHMKSVAASLFNFLDKDQNGKVTFKQLVENLYPDLSAEHYKIIKLWNSEYNQNFNLEKKIQENRQYEQLKKRILPKSCVPRYQQMFRFFDKDKKGFVSFEDLKRVLCEVSTEKQLMQVFQQNDKNKDGKLDLKEFMHILLPTDLEIEGL